MELAAIMSFQAMVAIENAHNLVVVLIFYVIEKINHIAKYRQQLLLCDQALSKRKIDGSLVDCS